MKRLILIVLVSCGGQTALPKGPPPDYEDEPAVTTPAPVAADAGVEQ